jgi:hypothetical protein
MEPGELEQCFIRYFHNLYSQPHYGSEDVLNQLNSIPIPTLSDQQVAHLDQPILDAEIIQAINQRGPLKTPGSDAVHATFYQKYWSTVQIDILNMVRAFFHSDTCSPNLTLLIQSDSTKSTPLNTGNSWRTARS